MNILRNTTLLKVSPETLQSEVSMVMRGEPLPPIISTKREENSPEKPNSTPSGIVDSNNKLHSCAFQDQPFTSSELDPVLDSNVVDVISCMRHEYCRKNPINSFASHKELNTFPEHDDAMQSNKTDNNPEHGNVGSSGCGICATSIDSSEPFVCARCNKVFNMVQDLDRHLEKHNTTREASDIKVDTLKSKG